VSASDPSPDADTAIAALLSANPEVAAAESFSSGASGGGLVAGVASHPHLGPDSVEILVSAQCFDEFG